MRNRFVKLASIVTMLALTLTGCSLIAVDPVMQADEDMATLVKEYSVPVVTYDGGEITKFNVTADYYNQYSYMYYIYSMYGYTLDESQAQDILKNVAEAHMNTRATLLKADEMGIALTDDEIAECESAGQTSYQEAYDTAYASAEGDTDELKQKATEYSLYEQGETLEEFVNQQKWTKIVDKVEEAVKTNVTEISDDDLQTAYTAKTAEDQSTYENDLSTFETDMNDPDKIITWMPEGYRTVKHILVKVDESVLTPVTDAYNALATAQSQLTGLQSELDSVNADADATVAPDATAAATEVATVAPTGTPRPLADIQADIDAKVAEIATLQTDLDAKKATCIASVQTKLDEIYAKLAAGEAFDDLMAEYGEDPGMQSDPAMTRGYYVSATSTTWDTHFRDGAMALASVGDYTLEPVISSSGVHIIYYNSDVPPGAVPLADIHDQFYTVALSDAQDTYMSEQLASWVAALNPVYTLDNFSASAE
jgi:parvulin-like peptidyl-prolyl isomerase